MPRAIVVSSRTMLVASHEGQADGTVNPIGILLNLPIQWERMCAVPAALHMSCHLFASRRAKNGQSSVQANARGVHCVRQRGRASLASGRLSRHWTSAEGAPSRAQLAQTGIHSSKNSTTTRCGAAEPTNRAVGDLDWLRFADGSPIRRCGGAAFKSLSPSQKGKLAEQPRDDSRMFRVAW